MLERIKDSHNDLYWSFMRDEHGIMYDNHYSDTFARWDVSQMFHTEDGEEIRGEYFSMQQAAKIAKEHGIDNVADVYVAVNANYHDRVVLFSKWFTETDDIDARIVSDAVTFYFGDEDAADGKIWRYINGTK